MYGLTTFEKRGNPMLRLFDSFGRPFWGSSDLEMAMFRSDVLDKGEYYELQAELPGFRKEEIEIDLADGRLVICAAHSDESEKSEENYLHRERQFGSFSRSFDVSGIEEEGISAGYENGLLTIRLPKMKEPQSISKKISIQ